jgi:hypothetical protein
MARLGGRRGPAYGGCRGPSAVTQRLWPRAGEAERPEAVPEGGEFRGMDALTGICAVLASIPLWKCVSRRC